MVQPNKAPVVTGEWECTECGHIEEGIETRRPAKCPECDAPADALEFFADEEGEDWEDLEEDADDDVDLLGDDDFDEDEEDDGYADLEDDEEY